MPAPGPSGRVALLGSVTEWVLAGQQTAICKHHEGKHQSTLDFFFIIFFFFCKHFRQTHNAFQR